MTEPTQAEVEAAIRAAGELGDDASTLEWVATILHAAAAACPAQSTDDDASLPTAEDVRGILGPPCPAQADVEQLADVINRARYPADRTPRALAEEDRSGQEYARRIARAVVAHLADSASIQT